jgi:glycosyltransferase involved in cell wall biosynthesis
MTRLLFILPGLVPPGADFSRDRFYYLSEIAEGEVLLPVWWGSAESAPPYLRRSFPLYCVGKFSYHLFLYQRFPKGLRKSMAFIFYLRKGLQLNHQKQFDAIVTYGTNSSGVAGIILKWLTGARLIVEVPSVPENAFRYDKPHEGSWAKIKRCFADQFLLIVGAAADCIKLLYPWQLQKYPFLRKKRVAVFHDFVPVHTISGQKSEKRTILSVGYPWYTKGIDIVIESFRTISSQFPDCKLHLLGHYPDRKYLDKLAETHPEIEFVPPGPYEHALRAISGCFIYVLASRTESMGRVLLEAMAARKPIVASAVGGVPHYIQHNDTGLLFESENSQELATMLVALLDDEVLRDRLAERAYDKATSKYDERAYVRSFDCMLQSLKAQTTGSRE